MISPIFWKFVLVTRAFEKLKVFRTRNGKPDNLYGTFPKGFACYLTFSDRVLVKFPGKRWLLKFEIGIHPTKKYPVIRYGKRYGPHPGQYRALKNLTQAALNNAGIELGGR